MGRKKLSPEEALERIRESKRRSKQRPEAIAKRREADRKRRAIKQQNAPSADNIEQKERKSFAAWFRSMAKMISRKKLTPEEALEHKKESERKSKQRPEYIAKRREADRIRRAIKRQHSILTNTFDEKERKQKSENKKKQRSDPVKYARELALQRERRKRNASKLIADKTAS